MIRDNPISNYISYNNSYVPANSFVKVFIWFQCNANIAFVHLLHVVILHAHAGNHYVLTYAYACIRIGYCILF